LAIVIGPAEARQGLVDDDGRRRGRVIWHGGYHHGQIKLALKATGRPFDDEEIGRVTWDVWIDQAFLITHVVIERWF
jgi:hypothetical protein